VGREGRPEPLGEMLLLEAGVSLPTRGCQITSAGAESSFPHSVAGVLGVSFRHFKPRLGLRFRQIWPEVSYRKRKACATWLPFSICQMWCWMAAVKPRAVTAIHVVTKTLALHPYGQTQVKVSSSSSNTKSEAHWQEQNTDTCMSLLHPASLSSANQLLS